MGDMLAKPETQKFSTIFETTHLRVACCSMQGWRKSMEDAHVVQLNLDGRKSRALFGVFDGHQSDEAARYCRSHMYDAIMRAAANAGSNYVQMFEEAYRAMDQQICQRFLASGTTANCVLLTHHNIVCANTGDSRAVLCRAGRAVPLSIDHKPTLPHERERIERAGGHVENGRVNMTLAVSRALGDVDFKQNDALSWKEQIVTACPDVTVTPSHRDDEFIVIGCDGIWDVLTSQAACDLVRRLLYRGEPGVVEDEGSGSEQSATNDISLVCEQILDRCLAQSNTVREGTDNMTIILVVFKKHFFDGDE